MSKHEKKAKKKDEHDKKRKHKKDDRKEDRKKDKDKSSKKRKTSSVSSEDVKRAMDIPLALKHMEALVVEFPDLVGDLTSILKMVDAGEAVVIGGIANKDMKARLAALFPLMGLVESGPNEAYSKHKFAKRNELLLDTFRPILQPPPTPSPPLAMLKPKAAPRVLGPIGPSMPPPRPPHANDDDDDDVVGPALPGMKGFREASADVQERMRLQAEADDALAWKRVRGEVIDAPTASKPILQREEWMLSLPDDESIQAALGGLGDQNARKFRGRDKDERDDSWFASPAERDQAMREKAQWEMLGYVPGKPEVAEAAAAAETLRARERMQVAAVPALPIARTDGDRSLLEKHQDALKKAGKPSGPVGWDRERDMASRRQLSGDAATALMQQAAEMSARFAAPKVTRTFL